HDAGIDDEEIDTEALLQGSIEQDSFFFTPPASPALENNGELDHSPSLSMQYPKADSELWEDDTELEPSSSTSQGCPDADLGTAAVRNIFKARGIPPLCDDNGEFGPAVDAPDGYEGYSIRFYPERAQALQIPSGEMTPEASNLRWLEISIDDMNIVRNYKQAMHLKLPSACRDIIKGTIRANFDPEVHRWLACRVKVLSEFPERSTEKADFINTVVTEFFYRFADLHPSSLFLKDVTMERAYVDKIKSSLSDLKTKQQDPSVSVQKTVAAFIPFLNRLLHTNTPTRPADMFFKEDGVRDLTKLLWDEHWAELKPDLIESEGSEDGANWYRISSYMAWRNWFFFESGFVPKDVQNAYISAAASQDKTHSLTPSEILKKGLPFINNLLYEFSKRTGIPFLLLMTWVDKDQNGQVQTMLQSNRGQASTDISNFRHSSASVDADLLPQWRSWANCVYGLNDEVPHMMYEHITPDEAAGCPEGTVPKIGGYLGAIDTSTEVKLTKARNDLLKYLGEHWCKANNRQRVNHDQMQLDINDKVPKSRLPKGTRSVEIERVLANGTSVVETVNREVVIPYTKITTMPAADFLEWLYHFADPQIPPENQFYFSAELCRSEEAGATMPVTVQAALALPPKPDDPSSRGSNPNLESAPSKKRARSAKGSKATSRSDLHKAKPKRNKESRDRSRDEEDTEEAEDFVLSESDDVDDLSDADLAGVLTAGSRKSQRIKSKGKSEVQEPPAGDDEADGRDEADEHNKADRHDEADEHDDADGHDEPPAPMPAPKTSGGEEPGSIVAQGQHHFLSSISITTQARRLPGVFSLSPAVDPLDSSSYNQITTSLALAKSNLENLPLPQFPCNTGETKMSGPRTVFDVLSLMTMLDHIFLHHPQLDHPRLCEKTIVVEPVDPALASAVSELVWTALNDPNVPIPMASTLQRLCTRHPEYAHDTFDTAYIWVKEALTLLCQRNFLSQKQACTATRIFSALCRYIFFVGRHPRQVHNVQNLVDIAAEWGTVIVTLTYAVHTTQAALLGYPDNEPRSPLTHSTAITQLLLLFLESLYKYISTRVYSLTHVASGDFLFLDLARPPCFSLSQPNDTWFSMHPNRDIESRIYKFLVNRLETNREAFHDLAIVGQMELLAVICASHNWKSRQMSETYWISWMRYLNSCILQEPPGDNGKISVIEESSARALGSAAERQPGNKETDTILPTQLTAFRGPRFQESTPGSSAEASTMPPPKNRPNDTSSTAPPTLSTAAEKVISEPVNEGASTAAPYRETLGDESRSSLPPTVQPAPLELDSASPPPFTGPGFWRPGDKARLAINKKMRDIELFLQDGTLQMRDSNTHNVLTDRQKKPKKDLPEFDRSLLYHRAEPSANTSQEPSTNTSQAPSANTSQELTPGVGSSSKGSIGKEKASDNVIEDSEVGFGGYGDVYLATLDGVSKVAVKQLRIIQTKAVRVRVAMRLARELRIWAKANHPNVLKLIGYHLSEKYDCAQLISPYMENGNVVEYMKRTQASIEIRLGFVRDITLGMAYLHGCDPPICHGDVKPLNVLISDKPDAVLCDFGLASFIEDSGGPSGLTTSRSIKVSPRYMSPELLDEEEAKHTLGSDIWAWACTVFEVVPLSQSSRGSALTRVFRRQIITDVIPYANFRTDWGIRGGIGRGTPPGSLELLDSLALEVDIPSRSTLVTLQALIRECWSRRPEERPSSSGILDRLPYLGLKDPDLPPAQAERRVAGSKAKKRKTASADNAEREDGVGVIEPEASEQEARRKKKARMSGGKADHGDEKSGKRRKKDNVKYDADDPLINDHEAQRLRDLRHRLQRGFLENGNPPQAADMPLLDQIFTNVENYPNLTIEYLLYSKLGKVIRYITKLSDIPRDDEFHFKERAKTLLFKWVAMLQEAERAAVPAAESYEANGKPTEAPGTSSEPATDAVGMRA
ncbi:hypothetical protein FS837_000370, partial [Tulasnella sp. UAMH 9824]